MASAKEYFTTANLNISIKKSKYDENHGKLIRGGFRYTVKKLVGASAPYTVESIHEDIKHIREDVTLDDVKNALELAMKKGYLLTREDYLKKTVGTSAAELEKKNSTLTEEVENLRKQLADARNRK